MAGNDDARVFLARKQEFEKITVDITNVMGRLEDNSKHRLDKAIAGAELELKEATEANMLEEKYQRMDIDESVNEELALLKTELGIDDVIETHFTE